MLIHRLTFRVFMCACPTVIPSIFGKSIHFWNYFSCHRHHTSIAFYWFVQYNLLPLLQISVLVNIDDSISHKITQYFHKTLVSVA